MGCTSAGAEQDAGTLYPTVVEDSNGNQIIIAYLPGGGAAWNNSSSRINTIEDARAQLAYQFSYSTTPGQDGTTMSYLSGIASYVGTQENYAVNIAPGQALYAPDNSTYAYTTAGMLKASRPPGRSTAMPTWDTPGPSATNSQPLVTIPPAWATAASPRSSFRRVGPCSGLTVPLFMSAPRRSGRSAAGTCRVSWAARRLRRTPTSSPGPARMCRVG